MEAHMDDAHVFTPERRDILAKLLDLRQQNPLLKRDDIIAMALTTLYAGFDTMGITLTATLYHMARKPGYQAQLHAELDAARKRGHISESPTIEEMKRLPFFQACISEAMRVHPTTGITLPRTVPKGGAEIDGYFLPEGVSIDLSSFLFNRTMPPSCFATSYKVSLWK